MRSEVDPRQQTGNAVVFVVVESGAGWPSDPAVRGLGCDVVKQEANESYSDLARRAQERIASIEESGGVVRVAVLSCSGDRRPEAFAGRSSLGRGLLGAVREAGGELRIVAPGSAPVAAWPSFISLADELMGALNGSSATLSLRFSDEAPSAREYPSGGRQRHAKRHGRAARTPYDRLSRQERRLPVAVHW